jgi:hypothetical protein
MRGMLAFVVAVIGGAVGALVGHRIAGPVGAIFGLCIGYLFCFGLVHWASGIMRDVRDIPSLWAPVLLFLATIIVAVLFFLRVI